MQMPTIAASAPPGETKPWDLLTKEDLALPLNCPMPQRAGNRVTWNKASLKAFIHAFPDPVRHAFYALVKHYELQQGLTNPQARDRALEKMWGPPVWYEPPAPKRAASRRPSRRAIQQGAGKQRLDEYTSQTEAFLGLLNQSHERKGGAGVKDVLEIVWWALNHVETPYTAIDPDSVKAPGALALLKLLKGQGGPSLQANLWLRLTPSQTQLEHHRSYEDDGRERLKWLEKFQQQHAPATESGQTDD